MDQFDAPWHYHPEYELTYILSSTGLRYTGNRFETFGPGDLVLLGPNLPHCWKNIGPQKEKAGAVVIHWREDLLGEGWLDKKEFEAVKKLLAASPAGIKFSDGFAANIRQKLLDFLALSPFAKLIGLLELLHLLAQQKDISFLCPEGFHGKLKVDDEERINRIYHYVERNYGNKITLAKAASHVHMGEEPFSRFFSKLMSQPFFSFVNQYRVYMAARLLTETTLPVSNICYRCGYESLPFFYRQFKKVKGCTPLQYRKKYEGLRFAEAK